MYNVYNDLQILLPWCFSRLALIHGISQFYFMFLNIMTYVVQGRKDIL